MNAKDLSIRAYLIEVMDALRECQYERAMNNTKIALDILSGKRKGDFEENFLKVNIKGEN